MNEDQIRQLIRDELSNLIRIDRYSFEKNIQILDGRNIRLGTATGTKIGTVANQKIGFFGATPVSQQLKASHSNWVSLANVVSALVSLGLFDQE